MKNLLFTAWKNSSRLKIGQFAHNHTFHFIEAKHVRRRCRPIWQRSDPVRVFIVRIGIMWSRSQSER